MKTLNNATVDELREALKQRMESEAEQKKPWPRKMITWAHTSKILATDEGTAFAREAWGDNQPPKAFWYIGAELKLTFEVQENGDGNVVSIECDGVRFEPVAK